MSMLVAQNIELFILALFGITIILIRDKGPKYRTPGNPKYEIYKSPPPYLTTWIRHCEFLNRLIRFHDCCSILVIGKEKEIECIALGEIISDYSYSRLPLLHFSVYFCSSTVCHCTQTFVGTLKTLL